ncbi:hypothetical protein [Streptomyces sp. MMBL 11-3]|uniref:hypothetical protein n=1 Tax=Streptomyces sp. MMBL 11-3 TaxID=3382639 RepID=UPI0039B5C190
MADERCVFPEDDSRPPGRWLDRDTAERLLRGEPLETADAGVRAQADRLAGALGALTATTVGTVSEGPELPGEDAALAAFRAARTGRGAAAAERTEPGGRAARTEWDGRTGRAPHARTNTAAPADAPPPGTSLDAGLVRLGRPGRDRRAPSPWGRPVRYGLAAALAAGMMGGVAVVASTGVLAFGSGEPEPGASATAAVTSDPSRRTPSPTGTRGDESRSGDGAGAPTGGSTGPGAGADEDEGTGTGARPGADDPGRTDRPGRRWAGLAAACRDHRDGKDLAPGRRRTLEDAAHGAGRVTKYCQGLLGSRDREDSGGGRDGHGGPGGNGGNGGDGKGDGGNGGGNDKDRGHTGPGTFKDDRDDGDKQGGQGNRNGREDRDGQGDRNGQGGRSDRSARPGVTFSAAPTQ